MPSHASRKVFPYIIEPRLQALPLNPVRNLSQGNLLAKRDSVNQSFRNNAHEGFLVVPYEKLSWRVHSSRVRCYYIGLWLCQAIFPEGCLFLFQNPALICLIIIDAFQSNFARLSCRRIGRLQEIPKQICLHISLFLYVSCQLTYADGDRTRAG